MYSFISQKYVTTEPPYLLKSASIDRPDQDGNCCFARSSQHGHEIAYLEAILPGIDAC